MTLVLVLVAVALWCASVVCVTAGYFVVRSVWSIGRGWVTSHGSRSCSRPRSLHSTAWPSDDSNAAWRDRAWWAVALAGCSGVGLWLPGCGWPAAEDPMEEVGLLEASQVLLATADGDALVLDCLVRDGSGPGERRPLVPLTLRARLPRAGRRSPIPSPLAECLATGAPTDIWLARRCGVPLVQFRSAGAQLTLELRSPPDLPWLPSASPG